jgi:hypothetical protein
MASSPGCQALPFGCNEFLQRRGQARYEFELLFRWIIKSLHPTGKAAPYCVSIFTCTQEMLITYMEKM